MHNEILWTVVRFPAGSWSYGGRMNDPAYRDCEKWQILASSGEKAVKKAQAKRSYDKRKEREGRAAVEVLREDLLKAGFVPTHYARQEGEFLVHRVAIKDLPDAQRRAMPQYPEFWDDDDELITEIIPDGRVQLVYPSADDVEGPHWVTSKEGRRLIADAISISNEMKER